MGWSEAEITRRLFVEHPPAPASVALVFGSAAAHLREARVRRGAALHAQGLVPRVLLTGGPLRGTAESEAHEMGRLARALGVPAEAILIEERSTNTFENAKFSATLLASEGLLHDGARLLLVSSPWHLGRVVRTMRKHVPGGTPLLAVPCEEACRRGTWTRTAACRQVVSAEALIFETFLAAGLLSDA